MKQISKFLLLISLACAAQSNELDYAPIPLAGGTVPPNGIFKISLKPLALMRYYKVSCTIEYPNWSSSNPDPVILKAGSIWEPEEGIGGVGTIFINGHTGTHSQIMLDRTSNLYAASDVFYGDEQGNTLYLSFENFHLSHSVTVTNCKADYMH